MSATIKRVLAATDLSDAATHAIDRAAQLARAQQAELCIVHALGRGEWAEQVFLDLPAGYRDAVRQAAESALEAERMRLQGSPGLVACDVLLIDDLLHRGLPELLARQPAELLVMGAHGAGRWTDLLLGSTADRVLRLHRLPVLLVRRPVGRAYARIGIATDFSPASEAAARFALRLLPTTAALGIHICKPESSRSLAFAGLSKARIEVQLQQRARRAMTELERFGERVANGQGQIVPALREGHPERALAEIIAEAQLDLLVLGVTGRSELEIGLLGSISAHAAANASCDVLLVPATAGQA